MTDDIATIFRANAAGINNDSDLDERWEAMKGPGVQAIDVQQGYEYSKSHPMEYSNLFYRWHQVHRIWQTGRQHCGKCWAEKEVIERKFLHGLGDITLFDESD